MTNSRPCPTKKLGFLAVGNSVKTFFLPSRTLPMYPFVKNSRITRETLTRGHGSDSAALRPHIATSTCSLRISHQHTSSAPRLSPKLQLRRHDVASASATTSRFHCQGNALLQHAWNRKDPSIHSRSPGFLLRRHPLSPLRRSRRTRPHSLYPHRQSHCRRKLDLLPRLNLVFTLRV